MAVRFDVGNDETLISRACALRETIFIIEQEIEPAEEWDGLDGNATHFVAVTEDGVDAGTGRMMFDHETALLQRIAVLKEKRGLNIGLDLIKFMLNHACQQTDISIAKLGAQCYAIPFYEKLSFRAYGDIYDDAGIPHRYMKRSL